MKEDKFLSGVIEFFVGLMIVWFIVKDFKLVLIISGIHLVLIVLSRFASMSTLKLVLLIVGIELFLG